jgi:hypothetical protein
MTVAMRPRLTSLAPQFLVDDLERSMGVVPQLAEIVLPTNTGPVVGPEPGPGCSSCGSPRSVVSCLVLRGSRSAVCGFTRRGAARKRRPSDDGR